MRGVRPGRRAADGCGDGRGGANDHPIEFAFQWDDAVAAREAGLALFDAFGSTEKTMHINPGPHGGIPRFQEAPFGTGLAKVEALSGVVRFKGAIATTGTNVAPFVLPAVSETEAAALDFISGALQRSKRRLDRESAIAKGRPRRRSGTQTVPPGF